MWKRVWARVWEWEVPAWSVLALYAVIVLVWWIVQRWSRGDFARIEP